MAIKTKNRLVIKSDTDTPPEGAEFTGEYYNWGGKQKKVFRETRELSELRPIMDPYTKGPMYKRGAGGVTLNAVMKERVITGTETREFIVDDLGNGQVNKVYEFREAPEEIERQRKKALRDKVLNELLDKAVEAGGIDALLAQSDDDKADNTPGFPQEKGAGWWLLSDGSKVRGTREIAEIAERNLNTQPAA